jgi:hypothetical protein
MAVTRTTESRPDEVRGDVIERAEQYPRRRWERKTKNARA